MSFMSRVFGATGSNNPPQQTQQNQPAASVANDPTNPQNAPKPDGTQPGLPKPTETLLDNYKDLNKAPAENEPQGGIPTPNPNLQIDPAQIREHMKNSNFLEGIPADLLQKATKGDAEAFMQVIQSVATSAATNAFAASAETTNRSLAQTVDRFNSLTLPELNRRRDSSQLIRKEMPFFEHPSVAPMLSNMETQLHNKYPNAAPEAIRDHAKNLMSGMFNEYAKAQGKILVDAPVADKTGRDAYGNEDWTANGFFDENNLSNPFG